MQIPSLSSSSLNPNAAGTGLARVDQAARTEPVSVTPVVDAAAVEATTAASSPLRPGASAHDAQLNRRVAAAQQTGDYLNELASRLGQLKNDLSAQIANPALQQPLSGQIQAVQTLWQQRGAATQGSLDGQLNFDANGQSRQTFEVRGLDHRALQSNERETLSFTTGSASSADQRVLTAVFEPGQSVDERVRLLDRTLAPAGIRVTQSAQGEVQLSTTEAQWPAVRDGLSIKGSGIRFPGQQFHRVRSQAQADAMRPSGWSTETTADQRQTLQQVLPALALVQQARQAVGNTLQAAGSQIAASASADTSTWAQGFAQDFARLSEQPPYSMFRAIAPAVQGISRPRVEALLRSV